MCGVVTIRHLVGVFALASCSSSMSQQATCGPGRVQLDGTCIKDSVADFVMCVRSRGTVELTGDRRQRFAAGVQLAGQNAGTVLEAQEVLKSQYSASGSAETEQQIVERCLEIVQGAGMKQSPERQPSVTTTPVVAGAAIEQTSASSNPPAEAFVYEDFTRRPEGYVPSHWRGTGTVMVQSRNGHRCLTQYRDGPATFSVPLPQAASDWHELSIQVGLMHWNHGPRLRIAVGEVAAELRVFSRFSEWTFERGGQTKFEVQPWNQRGTERDFFVHEIRFLRTDSLVTGYFDGTPTGMLRAEADASPSEIQLSFPSGGQSGLWGTAWALCRISLR